MKQFLTCFRDLGHMSCVVCNFLVSFFVLLKPLGKCSKIIPSADLSSESSLG